MKGQTVADPCMGMYSRNRGLFDPRLMEKPVYRSLVAVCVVEPRLGVRRVPDGEKFRVAMVPGGGVQLLPHGKRDKIVSGTVDDEERKPVFPDRFPAVQCRQPDPGAQPDPA